jgi:hypothetical protein
MFASESSLETISLSPISAAAKYFIRTRRRHRYDPQESSLFHCKNLLYSPNIKHILCIAPGVSHRQFSQGPPFISRTAFSIFMSSNYHPFSANCRLFCCPALFASSCIPLLVAFHYLHRHPFLLWLSFSVFYTSLGTLTRHHFHGLSEPQSFSSSRTYTTTSLHIYTVYPTFVLHSNSISPNTKY